MYSQANALLSMRSSFKTYSHVARHKNVLLLVYAHSYFDAFEFIGKKSAKDFYRPAKPIKLIDQLSRLSRLAHASMPWRSILVSNLLKYWSRFTFLGRVSPSLILGASSEWCFTMCCPMEVLLLNLRELASFSLSLQIGSLVEAPIYTCSLPADSQSLHFTE